jgi:predicted HicB family RNase H-like nuclease
MGAGRPSALDKPVTFTLRIERNVFRELEKQAEAGGLSIAQVIRAALSHFAGGRRTRPRRPKTTATS